MARQPRNGSREKLITGAQPAADGPGGREEGADLTFRQAQAALELSLAQLQAGDLDVETMADLYRRAEIYADRCDAILKNVEQEVMLWNPEKSNTSPEPFEP